MVFVVAIRIRIGIGISIAIIMMMMTMMDGGGEGFGFLNHGSRSCCLGRIVGGSIGGSIGRGRRGSGGGVGRGVCARSSIAHGWRWEVSISIPIVAVVATTIVMIGSIIIVYFL